MTKLLACGLGGGLDILNASLVYFAAKQNGLDVSLGSIKTAGLSEIKDHSPFADSGTILSRYSIIPRKRYSEPRIAGLLEGIFYFGREYNHKMEIKRLTQALRTAKRQSYFSNLFFIDGGGDSLILRKGDGIAEGEYDDPFLGGDAQSLEAISYLDKAVLGVIAVGLDVNTERFKENVRLLAERNAYFGRVNLATKESEDYRLENVLDWRNINFGDYFDLAQRILVLDEKDQMDSKKIKSHTSTVTYHALHGDYGLKRTFVDWEPTVDGQKGVIVKPEHCWMYFFDATKIHPLKLELNK